MSPIWRSKGKNAWRGWGNFGAAQAAFYKDVNVQLRLQYNRHVNV